MSTNEYKVIRIKTNCDLAPFWDQRATKMTFAGHSGLGDIEACRAPFRFYETLLLFMTDKKTTPTHI